MTDREPTKEKHQKLIDVVEEARRLLVIFQQVTMDCARCKEKVRELLK
jgi:hypothetical protein